MISAPVHQKGLKPGPVRPEEGQREGEWHPMLLPSLDARLGGLLHTWTPPGHLTALTHPPIPIAHPIDGT